jgi:hypothetical protein
VAHVELATEGEQSASAATLSGAARAASHPNVTHCTDTLVRMGYLQDFQKGVFLLSDPLGTKLMEQRNKVAKHIKSKADAEEAMLVLCREGKMELVNNGLFRIPHFEENRKPSGRDKASSGSSEHQPLKKKAKKVQAKPKVRKSVNQNLQSLQTCTMLRIPICGLCWQGCQQPRLQIGKQEYTKPLG